MYVQSERNQVNSVSFYVNENSKTSFRWSSTFLQKESNEAATKTSRGNIILALNELTPKHTYKLFSRLLSCITNNCLPK